MYSRYAETRRSHPSMSKAFKSSSARSPAQSKPRAGLRIACFVLGILPLPPIARAQTPPTDDKIEPVRTSITVVGTVAAETPASVSVLDNKQIRQTPGDNVDDRLRTASATLAS